MSTLTCPHCDEEIKITPERGFADEEGTYETMCLHCDKDVTFTVYIHVSYHATELKDDC